MEKPPPLTSYSKDERQRAMNKFGIIEPYLYDGKALINIEEETGLSKRTLRYWIHKYRKLGLKGLVRKTRSDSGRFKIAPEVQEVIKHLVLSHKRNAITSIHRKVCETCETNGWQPPSYHQVYAVAKSISSGMKKLAYEGKKGYQNDYDLIYRREAIYPNEKSGRQTIHR